MAKLSKWLKKNLKGNIKDTLKATIESLLQLDPPINRKSAISKQEEALRLSMQALLKNDKKLQKECTQLNIWLNVFKKEKENKRMLKVIDENDHAVFKKVRFFSSVVNVSYGTGSTSVNVRKGNASIDSLKKREFGKELQEKVTNEQEIEKVQETKSQVHRSSSPPIPQRFSFSASEQGSYVEPILQHVERAFFNFITRHEKYIPSKTVKDFVMKCNPPRQIDFSDADLLCLLNFILQIISLFTTRQSDQTLFCGQYKLNPSDLLMSFKVEARNYNAHAITQSSGRWNDEKLQRLSTLALEVVICLGGQDEYEQLLEIKRKLDFEIMKRLISTANRTHEDNEVDHQIKKRKLRDLELEEDKRQLEELTNFALDIIGKLESSDKEQLNRIVQMAISKNELLLNIWKSIDVKKDEDTKIEKFVKLMNMQFEMDLKPKRIKVI
ncbi:16710_t:CDS:2 [Cetraspora pellucida]|uniref:16710_t:CDS:1 n=1 Tax=Cetraspora pellucida TaxID=1433469 RepID=A0ACA9MBD3_9GLOM|nr:16710_t:CDS:2 [Cetraspora pellucida]